MKIYRIRSKNMIRGYYNTIEECKQVFKKYKIHVRIEYYNNGYWYLYNLRRANNI